MILLWVVPVKKIDTLKIQNLHSLLLFSSFVPQHVDVAEAKEGEKSDDVTTLHFAEP